MLEMHHCAAQLAYAVTSNHRMVRQVVLLYLAGTWTLISTECINGVHEGTHMRILDSELPEVTARLYSQVDEWRDEGYEVRCYRAKTPTPELDAG